MHRPGAVGSTTRARDPYRAGRALAWGCAWLALLALAGCTALSGSIADTVKLAASEHRSQMPGAAEVAANPYYQMYAATGSGKAVLILGNLDGTREAWYGKHHVVVFLRHGQVVKTAGLDVNLEGLHAPADNPFARGLQHLDAPVAFDLRMDWSGYRYGIPARVRLVPMGTTQLDILGTRHDVLRVDATVDAPAAHWHAVDRYWVDVHSGLVWKSEQHPAPGLALTLLQLKPFTGALP